MRACQHSDDHYERWSLWLWNIKRAKKQTRVPYSCNSWRCKVCRRHEAAVTFARIKQATRRAEYKGRYGWVYLVLTLDWNGYYSGKPWADVNDAYRSLSKMTDNFLHRLRRKYSDFRRSWVAVVEAHKTGRPHMNLMLFCPDLARELAGQRKTVLARGSSEREATLLDGDLLRHATECGWGRQSTAEAVRDTEALAGYLVKLVGAQSATLGELAKITQAPTNAPERFRRLRSGWHFLPARNKNPEVTGVLIRKRRSLAGDWEIWGLNASKEEEHQEAIQRAVRGEWQVIEEEENLLSQRGALPRMPPVRHLKAGKLESIYSPRGPPDSEVFENTG